LLIGVVSDTHIGANGSLPEGLIDGLQGVDLILHAGDQVDISAELQLGQVAPVKAVAGNMDSPQLRRLRPAKLIVEAGGRRIGLIHGSGPPGPLPIRVRREFEDVDIIVFGHSHQPFNQTISGVLMVNPGSPTARTSAPWPSYGIIDIGETVNASIIQLT